MMSEPMPSALRVLLVSHGLPPESVGGVEQHVEGLARALAARGHAVRVLAKSGRSGPAQGTLIEGESLGPVPVTRVVYRYEGLTRLSDMYDSPTIDAAFARFLAQHGPFDVAHVHHFTGLSTGILAHLRAAGVRSVVTLHDYWLMCPRGQMWHRDETVCDTVEPERCAACLRPGFGAWIPEHGATVVAEVHDHARRTLAAADQLVVPSARAIPPFEALGVPRERIRVVENGVDTEALAAVPDLTTDRREPLQVGFLGTLIPSKGLHVLVDAVQRLAPGRVELRIHGNTCAYHGDATYLTRVFGRLTPDDRVTYSGPYRTADLPGLLGGIDLLAAPALWREAFGLTVREALAAGRPVVASRIGGLADALVDGDSGYLLPPGDPIALARALDQLAADRPRLHALGARARSTGPGRGFAEMAGELEQLYRPVRS
jgi:glycosyltransferase involved in cell wall biosynthesis